MEALRTGFPRAESSQFDPKRTYVFRVTATARNSRELENLKEQKNENNNRDRIGHGDMGAGSAPGSPCALSFEGTSNAHNSGTHPAARMCRLVSIWNGVTARSRFAVSPDCRTRLLSPLEKLTARFVPKSYAKMASGGGGQVMASHGAVMGIC